MDKMLQINLETLPAVLVASALSAVAVIGYKSLLAVNKLIFEVGTVMPPTGILGKLTIMENEVNSIRDWAISQGYERRHGKIELN
jgi:hypothetical protein